MNVFSKPLVVIETENYVEYKKVKIVINKCIINKDFRFKCYVLHGSSI